MIELGKKDKIAGVDLLRRIVAGVDFKRTADYSPSGLPHLGPDEKVIAGYNQGVGERMIVCESLADMQEIYANYAQGGAIELNWYIGPDPGFVRVSVAGQNSGSSTR
jgi:hypothetical protein